jgi:hypothetical protein
MIQEPTANSDMSIQIWGRNQQDGTLFDYIEKWTEFHVDQKWADMSTWSLTMPYAEFNSVFKPAPTDPITKFSIAAYRNSEINPLIAGPITEATRTWKGGDDMLELTGMSDLWLLQARVMEPDWQHYFSQDGYYSGYARYCGYDGQPVEQFVEGMLYYYFGDGQPTAWRKIPYFNSGIGHSPSYGQNIEYWARWETAYEMAKTASQMSTGTAAYNYLDADLGFDVQYLAQTGAYRYWFFMYMATDMTDRVTFGTDLGTVRDFTYQEKKPDATVVIGGGPDIDPSSGAVSSELGYRLYHTTQNDTIYDLYGGAANHQIASVGRMEEFFDTGSVQTEAVAGGNPTKAQIVAWMRDKSNAELKLKQYNATATINLEPSEMAIFGTLANLSGEFRLGCKVSVQLNNMTLTDLIREVKLDFTPDGEVITPIVCDAFKFNWTRPMPFATENRWQLGEIGRNWK